MASNYETLKYNQIMIIWDKFKVEGNQARRILLLIAFVQSR